MADPTPRAGDDVLRVGDKLLFSFRLLREMVIREYLQESFPSPDIDGWSVEVVEIRRHAEGPVELVVKKIERKDLPRG